MWNIFYESRSNLAFILHMAYILIMLSLKT